MVDLFFTIISIFSFLRSFSRTARSDVFLVVFRIFALPSQLQAPPLWLLNLIQDDCYFLDIHIKLSTRCKMFHFKIT